MKKLPLFFFVLTIFSGCQKECCVEIFNLGIDVQATFNQDLVQVRLGELEVFNAELQTNQALGVCLNDGQWISAVPAGQYTLKVTVNNTITKTETFTLTGNHYTGINYDQDTKEITFVHSDEAFGYD
jgi:hypothetical protein